MRSTITRGVVLALLLLSFGLVAPAHSATQTEAVFLGTFTVIGGLGDISTLPPTTPTTTCLPLPSEFPAVDNCSVVYNSIRAAAMGHAICEDTTVNVGKVDKAPVTFGACALVLSGHITGHCGQNGGQMTGTYQDSLGNLFDVDVHYNSTIGAPTGGTLTMTGHATKRSGADPQVGLIIVNAVATPPTPLSTPTESCLNQTASTWQITGVVTLMTS